MHDTDLAFEFQNSDLPMNGGMGGGQSIGSGMPPNVQNSDLLFQSQGGGSLQMLNVAGRQNLNSLKKNQITGAGGPSSNFAMMPMNMAPGMSTFGGVVSHAEDEQYNYTIPSQQPQIYSNGNLPGFKKNI